MGLILFEGGTYPFPLAFLLLFVDSFVVLIEPPRAWWRVIRTGAVSGALTLSIGAARLWPIYADDEPLPARTRGSRTAQTIANVVESLTAREPHPWVWGHRWVWASTARSSAGASWRWPPTAR